MPRTNTNRARDFLSGTILEPREVHLLPTMFHRDLALAPGLLDALKGQADDENPYRELADLIDNPPTLVGHATERTDGRRVPVVLGRVTDPVGRGRAGIRVVLEDADGAEVFSTRTTPAGAFALRFPMRPAAEAEQPVAGRVRVLLPSAPPPLDVAIPGGSQHTVAPIQLTSLLPVSGPSVPDEVTDTLDDTTDTVDDTTDEVTDTLDDTTDDVLALLPEVGDDPFDVLPVDMTPELCDAVGQLFGPGIDTILTNPDRANDFRGRRTRFIKRVTVPRQGPVTPTDDAPRRYLVSLRQEYRFLGYTLGELADIDPLAPGQVIETASSAVSSATDRATSSVQEARRQVTSVLQSTLSRLASVDTLVDVSNRVRSRSGTEVTTAAQAGVGPRSSTGAIIGGIIGGIVGGPVGALVGAGIGSGGVKGEVGTTVGTDIHASLDARTITRTGVDSSLEVNSQVREAQSMLNQAISEVSTAVRSLRETTSQTLDQVSPLLSRVTNLLRWRLYENYAVCSHVEDVVELKEFVVFGAQDDDQPLFDDEDIVEYRRFFEPHLLEPRLAPHFDRLRAGLQRSRLAGQPVTSIGVTATVTTNGISGGNLEVSVGSGSEERSVNLRVRPGATRVRGTIDLPEALDELDDLGEATLRLTVEPALVTTTTTTPGPFGIPIPTTTTTNDPNARVTVTGIHLDYRPGRGRVQRLDLGSSVSATTDDPSTSSSVEMLLPPVAYFPELDPLFIHVNRNATYYFALLLQAAKDDPAMRDDVRQLVGAEVDGEGLLDSDSALWRLPIAGFEGNRILVVRDVDDEDEFGLSLLEDPGAGTLVQLAAPGAYGEALQGVLSLADAVGQLHPALLPAPAPAMPPLALVDLAGQPLQLANGQVDGP